MRPQSIVRMNRLDCDNRVDTLCTARRVERCIESLKADLSSLHPQSKQSDDLLAQLPTLFAGNCAASTNQFRLLCEEQHIASAQRLPIESIRAVQQDFVNLGFT